MNAPLNHNPYGSSGRALTIVTEDLASQGIWHPRVKFPGDIGTPPGILASPFFTREYSIPNHF